VVSERKPPQHFQELFPVETVFPPLRFSHLNSSFLEGCIMNTGTELITDIIILGSLKRMVGVEVPVADLKNSLQGTDVIKFSAYHDPLKSNHIPRKSG
jgi:hypothetical protein